MIEDLTKEVKQLEGSVTNFYNEATENITIITTYMDIKFDGVNKRLHDALSFVLKPTENDTKCESRIRDTENTIQDLIRNFTLTLQEKDSYLKIEMHNLESNMQNIKSEAVHLNKLF